ncbi:MAG: glycosyltransferase family 39 protein [Patescibacteria group bacterium]
MRRSSIVASLLIIVAGTTALASVWHDSPIVDEIPHIGAGYSYVAGHTYKFNPEHPPLAKDVAGLALLPLHISSSMLSGVFGNQWSPNSDGQWNFGRTLIYHSGTDPINIIHSAKLPMIIFFVFSAILIFVWTKKMYGARSGLLALFLFALSPTVIAHSRFVTTDVPALFGILLATYFFTRYLNQRTTKNFWLASVAFGIAMLTKFSTFLLVPYFIVLAIAWAWAYEHHYFEASAKIIVKTVLIIATGFIIIVAPVYQLHLINYPKNEQKSETIRLIRNYQSPAIAHSLIWASDKPVLRPFAEYGLGLAMVSQRAEGGNRTYFLGKLSNDSFKSYFPVVFALKEPTPFLILLISAFGLGFIAWLNRRNSFKTEFKNNFQPFAMALWVFIYMVVSIRSNLNIGIRHLMPIYGFLYILVAGQFKNILGQLNFKKWPTIVVTILCVWYAGEFVSVYPYYLTYFNEFAGGPSGGHRYVVDSNVDWGQDLWRLGDFVKENEITTIYSDYFGWADPTYYLGSTFNGIRGGRFTSKQSFLAENPNGGWLAISSTFYQESGATDKSYAWLDKIKPKTIIGNSILVWHIVP